MTFHYTQDVWIPLLYNGQSVAEALGNQDASILVDGNVDEEISSYGVSVAVNQALTQKIGMNMSYEYNDLDYTQAQKLLYSNLLLILRNTDSKYQLLDRTSMITLDLMFLYVQIVNTSIKRVSSMRQLQPIQLSMLRFHLTLIA